MPEALPRPLHVHLENLSTKPAVFSLTPALARAARREQPKVRFTCSGDLHELERHLATAAGLVTSTDVIRHARFPKARLAQAAPRLKFIHLIGAGVEGALPLDWLPQGVSLTNNSGVHRAKAREFVTMALLALNARLPAIVTHQREARWEQIFTPLARGRRLVVLGLGDMGRAAVAAGRSLGMHILGVRRSGAAAPGVARVYRPSRLAAALKGADFLVIASPLTAETRGLVGREALRALKPGAGVVNIGRAGVLDHEALLELLGSGHLGGAILDVLPAEPLPASSPLWKAPNLIVVPHVSSDDAENYMLDTIRLVCRNVARLRAGRALQNVVDPATGY